MYTGTLIYELMAAVECVEAQVGEQPENSELERSEMTLCGAIVRYELPQLETSLVGVA